MGAGGRAGVGHPWLAAALGALALSACSGPSPAATSTTIEAFVPQAVKFVEAHRGLRFKQPVKVRHLGDQAFAARVIQIQRANHADLDRQARVLRALGLLKPGVDAERSEEALLASGVVGFYDPGTRELEVRGDTATVAVRHVIVHELTHALQDQWFGLDFGGSGDNDDAGIAYTSLVEGDAVRIETAYIASLPAQDRRALAGRSGSLPSDVPRALIELLEFPYQSGPAFTQAILSARGQHGLDAAFSSPPTSSAQVIHPDRFLADESSTQVGDPDAAGAVVDSGTLGELGLNLVFESLTRTHALTAAQAQSAADAWDGDRYVTWSQGDGSCIRDRVAARTPGAATALLTALRKFAASRAGATVETSGGSLLTLTSCG